jgi:hypothetical protein
MFMHTSVRRIAKLCAALATGVAAAAAGLVAPVAPVAAADPPPPFQVTHPITYEYVLGAPTGTQLAIFVDRIISAETNRPFDPWVITAPDGLEVWASCARYDALWRLPISYVGQYGPPENRKTQINVYMPNDAGPEPWGDCQHVGNTRFQVYPARGYGSMMQRDFRLLTAHPGLTKPPKYRHPDGMERKQSECEAKPSDCPAFVPGMPGMPPVPAQLLLELAGADGLVDCPTCPWGVSLTPVAGGSETFLTIKSLTRMESLGIETAVVEIVNGIGPGKYKIKVGSVFGGQAAQDHFVTFG